MLSDKGRGDILDLDCELLETLDTTIPRESAVLETHQIKWVVPARSERSDKVVHNQDTSINQTTRRSLTKTRPPCSSSQ